MAHFKVFACFSIYLVLNIDCFSAENYTYISNFDVDNAYINAGYTGDYVQKSMAEGNATFNALNYIFDIKYNFGEKNKRIEFIVASTGGNSCSYIYGEAERLKNASLKINKKPSIIIVVYTLNYVNHEIATKEYGAFKNALEALIAAGALHKPQIKVDVKLFCPVVRENSKLHKNLVFHDLGTMKMEPEQLATQEQIISDLNDKLNQDSLISSDDFKKLLNDRNIKLIVDCVVGSGLKAVNKDNQLFAAIPRAQIRIMATAIQQKKKNGSVFVISNDSPSGMDENGEWNIHGDHWYPVDVILSCVWNKKLVNSIQLNVSFVFVLDIEYNGIRLFDKLVANIPSDNNELFLDVTIAIRQAKGGVIKFQRNPNANRMLVL